MTSMWVNCGCVLGEAIFLSWTFCIDIQSDSGVKLTFHTIFAHYFVDVHDGDPDTDIYIDARTNLLIC